MGVGRAGQTARGTQRAQLTYDHDRRPGQQGEEREEHGLVGVQDVLEEPSAICSPDTQSPESPHGLRAVPMLSGRGAGSEPSQPRPAPGRLWLLEPTCPSQDPASGSREEAQLPPLQGHAPKAEAVLKRYKLVTFYESPSSCL